MLIKHLIIHLKYTFDPQILGLCVQRIIKNLTC